MTNLKTIQEFSRTPENIQGQQDAFQESRIKRVLIANSRTRTVIGAQGRLTTLRGGQICSTEESLAENQKQQPQNQFVASNTVQ